jgi:inner membrane protein
VPTALSHPAVPLAIGLGLGRGRVSGRLLAAGAAASMLPDADVLAFRFGIPYAAEFGHRGFTHSLAFAAAVAIVGGLGHRTLRAGFFTSTCFLFAATASHPLLDVLTDGGLGAALLWPFSPERFFAPVRPIHVAPLSWRALFSVRGVAVITSEVKWVWLPSAGLAAGLACLRTRGWRAAFPAAPNSLKVRRPAAPPPPR